MPRDLPTGTVTFLFTDVEGSTRLLHELGAERYAEALADHRRVLRNTFDRHDGVEVDTQGDAFFVAFPTAPGALAAAIQAREGLGSGPIRVRIGIHTGTPLVTDEGYVGADVHRAARIAAAGHGGQVLVSSSTAALVAVDGLRDLGEHRLKDLSAPERIYQLGDGDFPPLKTLYQTNLPIPATLFVGREHELGDLLGLLGRDDVRLLTLTGPGGTGKTRLALQAAAEAAEAFPHGVFWVPLAPLRDPGLVLESAAQALTAQNGLAEHIGDRSLLLLLDNFEHVIDAATNLSALLSACPNLHVLVTSRELLRVPGEQAYAVPPLERDDGVELFVARARAVRPDFVPSAAVPELCARLENLPLALELAAARVVVLSPDRLLDRLSRRLDLLRAGRGVDRRQQTLRATIEWSYELLDADEQELFARLAVFRGGCTLEAAEEVCEADLDTLESLVDKSLVRVRDDERFWMLETIREFAAERLEESEGADDLRRRHAEHFLALGEEAEPYLRGSPGRWLDRLEAEHDNLRAALDRLEASNETQLALRLAGALSRFWTMRGHFPEGRRRLEAALRSDDRPTRARGDALNGAALLALESGDTATGRRHAEEGLTLNRRLGYAWGAAVSGFLVGCADALDGEFARAERRFDEGTRIFSELGDEHYTLLAIRQRAWMHFELGDFERARALHEEVVRRARALGNERMTATSLGALAEYALYEGRVRDALPMLEESTRIYRELGEELQTALNLCRFALARAREGRDTSAAVMLLAASETMHEQIGVRVPSWVAEMNETTLAAIRAELDEASFADAWERGRALSVDEAVALALGELE